MPRTGRVLFALGNVKASKGLQAESFDLHYRALAQFQATIGKNHHRTADVCVRVAQHWIARGKDRDSEQNAMCV